ncbi:MAG TPA: heavy-metal-associated domain-containing protein [Novosphingobium sp.]|nr:heavy-metal-associated domain-containing protein [Novosphingobium sp.]
MAVAPLPSLLRSWRPGPVATLLGGLSLALVLALALTGPERLWAQIEGDRGIVPVASTSDIEIMGIEVNTSGNTAEEARLNGWQEAARKAWAKAGGPAMSDGQLQGMVSAVVIEREQIGPKRYVATLSVVFDRARAGQYIGGKVGGNAHSAPLLVIPVLHSGGTAQVFEVKGPWQRAWAEFRAGNSPIDYVRPSGGGGDSLLITAGQPSRRSRAWWRNVLDQFGAADVIMPEARLERQWPGGPIRGTFTARYGPDNTFLESFTLTANDEAGLPKMLADAVVRLDQIYARALADGRLKPDTTLNVRPGIDPGLAALIAAGQAPEAAPTTAPTATPTAAPTATPTVAPVVETRTFTVQFASPDAAAVDAALGAVRGAPGVKGASTTSLAVGGTSVMRVTYEGDLDTLAAALRARGWKVTVGNNALSIRR